MSISIIEKIRLIAPNERPDFISSIYEKNIQFFQANYPDVFRYISTSECPYQINITDGFLEIVHSELVAQTNQKYPLDFISQILGDWVNDSWVELIDPNINRNENFQIHYNRINNFLSDFENEIKLSKYSYQQGKLFLHEINERKGTKFSPPVIFLGIFHGLHIDYFLSRTEVANILLIEPDPIRFEVSCYFLDYEKVQKRFGKLLLSIGPNVTTEAIKQFFNFDRVTPQVWTRVLPAYEFKNSKYFIDAFRKQQSTGAGLFFPIDMELRGLENTYKNLLNKNLILGEKSDLSSKSIIVIIGSGPSLDDDLCWLYENQSNVIIFAAHSSVRALKNKNIIPDFQFSVETKPEQEATRGTLIPEVPLVAYCRAHSSWAKTVDTILLVSEHSKAQVFKFLYPLTHTHPSTVNMAFSLALHLGPDKILLVGCDFGYRDKRIHHARESLWKEHMASTDSAKDSYVSDTGETGLAPNFSGTPDIYNQPFLEQARLTVQEMAVRNTHTKIYNLSDGAKINGTKPLRSSDLKLKRYQAKNDDVAKILKSFSKPKEGVNFQYYDMKGKKLLKAYCENIINEISLKQFSWQCFSNILDNRILDKKLNYFSYDSTDWRMDIYSRLLNDLLRIWYQYMLGCKNERGAEELYFWGLEKFKKQVSSLSWPALLDERLD